MHKKEKNKSKKYILEKEKKLRIFLLHKGEFSVRSLVFSGSIFIFLQTSCLVFSGKNQYFSLLLYFVELRRQEKVKIKGHLASFFIDNKYVLSLWFYFDQTAAFSVILDRLK